VRPGANVNNGKIFKSSFVENILADFYMVAVTSRQKPLQAISKLMAWFVVLFTICTMKNKSTFGVSESISS